jgi:hypothetical protein
MLHQLNTGRLLWLLWLLLLWWVLCGLWRLL